MSHRTEFPATGLIDAQHLAIDFFGRSAKVRGTSEMGSCIGEAMRCRSNLGENERHTYRIFNERELRGEHVQTVECVRVAEKLQRQTFFIDYLLRDPWAARVSRETRPCAAARALQVDRRDLPVGRGRAWTGQFP